MPLSAKSRFPRAAADADKQALLQLSLLILAGLASTLAIFLFMVLASMQAVSMIDAGGREREVLQVTRSLDNLPGGINEITIAALGERLDLSGVRVTSADAVAPGEVSVSLAEGSDRVVAWMPRQLGAETFDVVAPMRIGMGVLFVLLVGLIGLRVTVIGRSIDRRRRASVRLAMTDSLTGLGNRLAFDTGLGERWRPGAEAGEGFALLLLDLDGFKAVNDRYGHAAGDAVLQRVARHLRETFGDALVTRLGGDEFAVLCPLEGIDARIDEIRQRLRQPLELGTSLIPIAASIGMARSIDFSASSAQFVHAADTALYRAKRGGHGRSETARRPRRRAA